MPESELLATASPINPGVSYLTEQVPCPSLLVSGLLDSALQFVSERHGFLRVKHGREGPD